MVAPDIVHEVLQSPGFPLDATVQAYFGTRFGHDFSRVRVHADTRAAQSAQAVQALAYTVGDHVAFGAGLYAPQTGEGLQLLAHELAHVAQQGSLPQSFDFIEVGSSTDAAESQAEHAAKSENSPAAGSDRVPYLARQAESGTSTLLTVQQGRQIECVKQLGGCPETRPAGIPTDQEISDYNRACRRRTGYSGPDLIPTSEQCRRALFPTVSIELEDAPPGFTPEERVAGWLQVWRTQIVAAETRWRVDRRAIAGAIAWEALENVRRWHGWGLARFRGPGKVHYKEHRIREGDPVARQVERAGYLGEEARRRTKSEREELLGNTEESIRYIAAIMRAFADIASGSGYDLGCDPAMLTTFYNAWDLNQARSLFQRRRAPESLSPNEFMGAWVRDNLDYLESAVGSPAICGQQQRTP